MKLKLLTSAIGLALFSWTEKPQTDTLKSDGKTPPLHMGKIRIFVLLMLFLAFGNVVQGQTSTVSSGNQINIGGLARSGTNQVVSQFQIVQATSTVTLTQIVAATTGTYTSSDITSFKLYGGSTTDFATATLLKTLTPLASGSGETLTFNSFVSAYSLTVTTHYFWIVADVSGSATLGRTLKMSAIANTGFTVSGGSVSGSVPVAPANASVFFNVVAATPTFTTGNIVGLIAANSNASNTSAVLVELNTTSAGQSVNTPAYTVGTTASPNSIRISGSTTANAYLANSNDGSLLAFPAHVSTALGAGTNVTTMQNKAVISYSPTGVFSRATTYTGTGSNQTRGATSIDNSAWYIGDAGGLYTNGATTPTVTTNLRAIKSFGGTAYALTSTATNPVGTYSSPTATSFTALPGSIGTSPTITAPFDFYLISSGSNGSTFDVLYMVTGTSASAGVVYKYSLVSGSWVSNGSYATSFGGYGLAARKSGSGAELFISSGTGASAANSIIKCTDTAGFNATISITTANNVTLYSAPTTTSIKGVAFSPSNPSIALSAAHPVASNINQGSINNIIGSIACAVTTSSTTLNAVTVTTAGTYSASDLTTIRFWYNTTNSLTGATQLGSDQAAVASGASVGVSGLSQAIAAGTTGYILVTASVDAAATLGNTIRLASTAFSNITFSSGTKTGSNPIAAGSTPGNDQTISQVTPTITLANGSIAAGNINQNTTNNVLYRADFTVADANALLTSASFTTSGTYTATDLSNFKLWYSTNSTFSSGTSTLLATKTTSLGTGLQTFSPLSQTIAIGTGYLYLTADLSCYSTLAATIAINATATTDFSFTLGSASGSGFSAGGTKTIIAGTTTPSNPATFTAVGNGTTGQISATWTPPTGCYDDFMIVASPLANTGGTPTGDGSAYTTGTYGLGTAFGNGFVVYKGTSSPQALTGFTNGTGYFIKIFTRYNTLWSAGTEVNFVTAFTNTTLTEVVVPQYMHSGGTNARVPSAYCVTLSGLTPNTTYRYVNTAIATSQDNATGAGAGNSIYPGTTQTANFVWGTPSLSSAYGTFTTNSSGSYTGWFITEPTTNSRFTAGGQVFFRIRLNDGNNGTFVDRIATTTSSSTVLTMSTSAGGTNATAIRSTSSANAKDFVCLYDNTAGTGRPLAATYIEDDGNNTNANFATFITSGVNAVAGAWGAVLPNALPNGLRRIETRSFTDGSVICSSSDSDGVWTTGSVNTVNPTGGSSTVLVIANADAALNCSSIALNHTGIPQTSASTENLNTNDNIISNFRVITSTYATSLNSISFTIGGTFVAGDVSNFKLYTSTSSSFPGGTALSTVAAASIASGDTITFSSLSQACAVGSRYFWITADFNAAGTTGNTIFVPALVNTDFNFANNASIITNSIAAGGVVTFGIVEPTIVVSSSTISAGTINDGATNAILYRADVAVSVTSASLNSISFTTTGSYVGTDITNFKLWYSSSSTFATGASTLLATKTTSLDAGLHSFTGLTQTIPSGTIGYFYLTTDLPCSTTTGNTIGVDAVSASDLTFALGTGSGSGTATDTQTITIATPSNVTGVTATATGVSQQISLAYTLPTTCYDEIMIVAATAANTASPTGDGSAYSASLTYGSGTAIGNGRVVYKGNISPQAIVGLTNGTPYYFKIFTRNGTLWSAGTTDVTATPVALPALTEVLLPQYIQGSSTKLPYAYRVTLYNLLPNATYRYFNQVVLNTDTATSTGAGNIIFANSGGFTLSSSPSLNTAGGYSTFTTDSTGSYTGWFITEPTSNARFTAGNTVNMRIMLNDGGSGTTVATRLTTTSGVTVINLGTSGSNVGTGIRGTSYALPRNFVMLYDTVSGSGRPISGTYIESDGTGSSGYASFYTSSVQGVAGAWGTIIPNTLANGVRKIQEYSFSTGNPIGITATDSNGIWPSSVNTTSPNGGSTAVVISTTDAPLEDIPTSSILTGTTSICVGSSTNLSIAIIGGTSPYRVVYNDGTSNITLNNYLSGSAISVSPSTTTTYTLVSVTDAADFVGVGTTGSATVTVNTIPTATMGIDNTSQCINQASPIITFTGANGNGVVRYKFYYTINGGSELSITSASGISTATLSISTATTKNDVYTLTRVEDVNSGCSQAQSGSATVTIGLCTQLRPKQCGKVLPSLTTAIEASPVVGATQYRFEVTRIDTNTVYPLITSSLYYFYPAARIPGGLLFGKSYSIRVQMFIGTWLNYGSTCIVTAPNAPLIVPTKIRPMQCGQTLATINTQIQASPVYGATQYQFSVTPQGGTETIVTSSNYFFSLLSTPGLAAYSKAYAIKVNALSGGNWTGYGDVCIVTTPAIPATRLITSQCGVTFNNLTFTLNASPVSLVTKYRFRVVNGATERIAEVNRTYIVPSDLAGGYANNTVYTVDVATLYNGLWSAYGPACTVSTPFIRMAAQDINTNVFEVKAFPNPFARHFSLDIQSSSDDLVQVHVYDMIGRELEVQKATVSELSTREIGTNYPSGVYNVVVSQGDKVRSVRMIKR